MVKLSGRQFPRAKVWKASSCLWKQEQKIEQSYQQQRSEAKKKKIKHEVIGEEGKENINHWRGGRRGLK